MCIRAYLTDFCIIQLSSLIVMSSLQYCYGLPRPLSGCGCFGTSVFLCNTVVNDKNGWKKQDASRKWGLCTTRIFSDDEKTDNQASTWSCMDPSPLTPPNLLIPPSATLQCWDPNTSLVYEPFAWSAEKTIFCAVHSFPMSHSAPNLTS